MCEVSDKLQLCSCAKVDIDNAKHYWVYYRFVKGQEIELMGLTMMPVEIDEKTDLYNRVLLKKLLVQHGRFFILAIPEILLRQLGILRADEDWSQTCTDQYHQKYDAPHKLF